jgi:hypothetical protein
MSGIQKKKKALPYILYSWSVILGLTILYMLLVVYTTFQIEHEMAAKKIVSHIVWRKPGKKQKTPRQKSKVIISKPRVLTNCIKRQLHSVRSRISNQWNKWTSFFFSFSRIHLLAELCSIVVFYSNLFRL